MKKLHLSALACCNEDRSAEQLQVAMQNIGKIRGKNLQKKGKWPISHSAATAKIFRCIPPIFRYIPPVFRYIPPKLSEKVEFAGQNLLNMYFSSPQTSKPLHRRYRITTPSALRLARFLKVLKRKREM